MDECPFFFQMSFQMSVLGVTVKKKPNQTDIEQILKYHLTKTNQHFKIICVPCQDYWNTFNFVVPFGVLALFPSPGSVK